jgi:hypothetical protein
MSNLSVAGAGPDSNHTSYVWVETVGHRRPHSIALYASRRWGNAECSPPGIEDRSGWVGLETTSGRQSDRPLTSQNAWSERRESNPRSQLGKLMYCLCTTLAGRVGFATQC